MLVLRLLNSRGQISYIRDLVVDIQNGRRERGIHQRQMNYLAAFVFSGHIVQHGGVVDESIQFPAGKEEENDNGEMEITDLELNDGDGKSKW